MTNLDLKSMKNLYDKMGENVQDDSDNSKKMEYFKINSGDNYFHIVPPLKSMELPHYPIQVHFIPDETGKSSPFKCTKTYTLWKGMHKFFGECPICEKYYELKKSTEEEDILVADQIRPQPHFLFYAVKLEKPDSTSGTVGLLQAKFSYFPKICAEIKEDLSSDMNPFDPTKGLIVIVSKTGSGKNNTKYDARASRARSKLDPSIVEKYNDLPDISTIYETYSESDLRKVLSGDFDPKGTKTKTTEQNSVENKQSPDVQPSQPIKTEVSATSKLTPEQQAELEKLQALMKAGQ